MCVFVKLESCYETKKLVMTYDNMKRAAKVITAKTINL